MPANRTTIDGALKDLYLPVLAKQINDSSLLANQISTRTDQVTGRKAVFAVHTRRNSGIGARAENDTLPVAGSQKYGQAQVGLCGIYGRIELSGKLVATAKGGAGAYVNEPAAEIEGIELDLKRDWCRMLVGTGDGVIASTAVTTSSTTVNLNSGTGANAYTQLSEGMVIDIGTVANPTAVASNREVLSVDEAADTITISGAAVTTATTDRIFRAGSGGNQTDGGLTYGKETNGLGNIVSDSTVLHTLDPATEPTWKSHVDTSGGSPTASKFMKAAHAVNRKSGTQFSTVLTTDGVLRAYGDTLTSLKQSVNTVDLKGGFNGLSLAVGGGGKDVVITWDRDIPPGVAYAVQPDSLALHTPQGESGDWHWADDDGAILSRVSGKDAFEAFIRRFVNLATYHRNRHAVFSNLVES